MAPRKPIKPTSKAETKTESKNEFRSENPKKNKPATHNHSAFFQDVKAFVTDERTRFVMGVLLLLGVLYLSLAFVSYFFTGAADQSKLDLPMDELRDMRADIQNWTSVTGAVLAEDFIHHWFGISSFSILIFGGIAGMKLLNIKSPSLWKSFFHTAFWLLWLSVTLGFAVNPFVKDVLFFAPGGQHGEGVSQWLSSYVGYPGTAMILIAVLLTYCVISFTSTLPFVKGLFSKQHRVKTKVKTRTNTEDIYNDEDETEDAGKVPTVAVGTEIIPDDWVVKGGDDQESFTINPDPFEVDKPVSANNGNDISFEIETPVEQEDVAQVPDLSLASTVQEEDNVDPAYNLARLGKYDPTLDLSNYVPPTLELLKVYGSESNTQIDMVEQNANKNRIITTLQNYGIEIDSIKATVGPTITLYEIVPKAGIRISKIRNLEYDIMLSLAATGIRIIAPIPGKGTIGIEVPNADPQVVSMHSVIASKKFQESRFELPVAFGRTITNEIFMVDLAKMPHLLVAGATGQGKSVGLNAIITSLLYKKHPAELKLVLVDPKKVEFNIYGDIEKHFLAKLPDGEDAIITDTSKVVETLNSLCKEMDDRYNLLKTAHVRNIKEYNEKFYNRHLNPEKGHRFLPYIVVIVDEFGDLIMTAGKEVEMPIARIAQLARAVGIHMIIATQRPSVNIITGVIKANFPARVAFRVSSMIDSRTILDAPGANQLVGRGDMLFSQGSDLTRVQCAFVDTPEVEGIVHYISDQQSYPTAFYLPEYTGGDSEGVDMSSVDMSKRDPLFEEAARLIVASQQGSTSLIQRKFSIGYNRAGRIVDQLEVAGIIGPFEGSKARQVLVMDDYHLEQILRNL
jgi:S-DNA-T family DNA segregation ATPase FtsK/SpoIIIE